MHSICGREYATGLLLLLALASLSVVSNVRALTADLYRRPLQDKAARSGLPDHLANCASLRWDAVYPLGSTGSPASSRDVPLFHPACADPLPGAKPARQATVELPFELKDFRCTNTTQDVCDMGRATIERAGLRIAKAIKFKQPVYVQVNLTSFCRNATYCSLEEQNGIGGASPASFIEGVFDNAKDEPVSIPAALWKQIYNGPAIAMAPYDITSRFNVIYDFHFVEEGTILPTETDFEVIIVHELLHGLGMLQTWRLFFQDLGLVKTQDFVEPNFSVLLPQVITNTTLVNDIKIGRWLLPNIFEKFVQLKNMDMSLAAASRRVQALFPLQDPPLGLENWYKNFTKSGEPYNIGKQVLIGGSTAAPSANFRVSPNSPLMPGSDVALFTYNNIWASGSTMSHLSDDQAKGPGFLLISAVKTFGGTGKTLDQLAAMYLPANYSYGVLGPQIIAMLSTIGYATMADHVSNNSSTPTVNGTATATRTAGVSPFPSGAIVPLATTPKSAAVSHFGRDLAKSTSFFVTIAFSVIIMLF